MRRSVLTPLVLALIMFASMTPVQANTFVSCEVTLETSTGEIFGTLLAPAEGAPQVPVVLIIAGSGPTDRNGNSSLFPAANNSLKQIAEGLARSGVASLRYDKRGVAASAGAAVSEQHMRFGQSIDDAIKWCEMLAAGDRFSAVVVAGHSQGSLVGMNAAWEAGADGFASLAGVGHRACDALRVQLKEQLGIQSWIEAEKILTEIEQGRMVEEPPAGLSILFRPSVQPFLMSWQRYDPVRDIARLQVPVLIMQGATDVQVAVEEAELLKNVRPDAAYVLLEGHNHIFKPVEGKDLVEHHRSLADSTLMVSPEAVAALVQLVSNSEQAALANAKIQAKAHIFNRELGPSDADPAMEELLLDRKNKPTAANIGFWARYFDSRSDVLYCFGPNDGGYVAQGAVALDTRHDCVSLLYRCSELARSESLTQSINWALRTRFAGAPLASFVEAAGNVNYDHPAHLDYSLDMIRTGMWGSDVTTAMTGVALDDKGTSRYPAGSFSYVASDSLLASELKEGDVLWLVLNPEHEKGAKLRNEYGLVIGHIGLVVMEDGAPWMVHAASSDLEGYYQGGTVVKVPLAVYLEKVEKFAGVMVTRFMGE